ncbi:MAG: hypothetical protein Q4E69_01255 [Bacilli bacterium]|nr:hypothetical protein [Bacilli bacterium]
MKKIFGVLLLSILFLTGCGNALNTPTKAVEEYLKTYQNLDDRVITQLDDIIDNDNVMSEEQKKDYRELMINQYKNFSYKVVDENETNDEAEVEIELEVLDYASSIGESRIYYNNHRDEFKDDEKSTNNEVVDGVVGDTIDNMASFIDYKIKNMKNVTNKSKTTITFYLNKIDNEWVVEDLSATDIQKLHGLYEKQ